MADLISPTLGRRLVSDDRRPVTIGQLAQAWFHQDVEVTLQGAGLLQHHPDLLPRVRGAWGRRLMASASSQAIDGGSCSWSPPCALDVFFLEQARVGGEGLPKPYVLQADRRGDDLVIRLRVIGFACEWIQAAAEAFTAVFTGLGPETVNWQDFRSLPKNRLVRLIDRQIHTTQGLQLPQASAACWLSFVTPMDSEKSDGLPSPQHVLHKILARGASFAGWQDAVLADDLSVLRRSIGDLEMTWNNERTVVLHRQSRQTHRYGRSSTLGALALRGDLSALWPALVLGQAVGCGRGAAAGQGRFALTL